MSTSAPEFPTKRILGIDFFDGAPADAIAYLSHHGGLVVAPAAPSLIALQRDPDYRRAIADADLAIADSGWMVVFWKLLRGETVTRISGLKLFNELLASPAARVPRSLFWILPSETGKTKALEFARGSSYPVTADDCYVAPHYGKKDCSHGSVSRAKGERGSQSRGYNDNGFSVSDPVLLAQIEARKPQHVIIAIGGGMQDKLGSWLKHHLSYRPAIYCIGAAPGFVTGDQVQIPMWADRFFVGWIFRIVSEPKKYFNRYVKAIAIPRMIIRFGRRMPPLIALSE